MHNGTVAFHKDGYTDLRGKFDYASTNDLELSQVKRFAILVLSDEYGAQIGRLYLRRNKHASLPVTDE